VIVFTNTITHRLKYITGFFGSQYIVEELQITTDITEYLNYAGSKINYSRERILPGEFWLEPHSILFETGIQEQQITCFEVNGYKAFFKSQGDFEFDIFAASFYLLSRYEEYLPHQKDIYGRYAHQNSLAFRENFLNQPLVNAWFQNFIEKLKTKFSQLQTKQSTFSFIPTYDIDEAYSFRYKQWWRSAGAAIKDLFSGNLNNFRLRRKVLNSKIADPYDSFNWINNLHRSYKLKPRYFFLVSEKTGRYDKNILPNEPGLQVLIKNHADQYEIGVHPSWQSGNNSALLKNEIQTLEKISKLKIIASRQHFIRFTLPQTFRNLIAAGIKEDYSMGYGSINGFRSSVASPHYWYDLEKEEITFLKLFPYCYMEANSFFEQKYNTEQALNEMRHYYHIVKSVNGLLITIWHNTFLGTDKKFAGWREVYSRFIKDIC